MGRELKGNWGPIFWKFLHEISFQYPNSATEKEKKTHEYFLKNLSDFIPCQSCKNDYEKYIIQNPPNLKSKTNLIKWTVDLHNHVNKKLGKREYSYEEVEEEYNSNSEHCINCLNIKKDNEENTTKNLSKYIKIVQVVCFVFFLLFLFMYLEKKYKIVNFFKSLQSNKKKFN